MRPVSAEFPVSQPFGSMKTQGVAANSNPSSGTGYYVYLYGNYQPFGHAGCDIACPEGTPVHAIAAGTVLWADWGTNLPGDESNAGYRRRWYLYKGFPGIVTVIQHDGWIGVYAHLSAAHMNPGDTVTEGQQIGLSGGTGGVAPHLHIEALIDLTYRSTGGLIYGRTDPSAYFGGDAAAQGTITPQSSTEPSGEDDFLMALSQETQAGMAENSYLNLDSNARIEAQNRAILETLAMILPAVARMDTRAAENVDVQGRIEKNQALMLDSQAAVEQLAAQKAGK